MPEPTTTTTAAVVTLSAAGVSVPPLVLLGVNLGLRPDVLIAGFSGALVAIVLLNSVPSEGDTWRHLLSTTFKRMFVTLASSLVSGYLTPLFMLPLAAPLEAVMLATAFALGAGAQKAVRKAIEKFAPEVPTNGGAA